jgi:cysteinyl-tRNA synthetase
MKIIKEHITLLQKMLWVLGIDEEIKPLTEEDLALVRAWHAARDQKDFNLADKYREEVYAKGIIL